MITEVAILYVKPGFAVKFESDFSEAGQYISSIPGYQEHTLQKCIETSNKYVLLARWDKLEDHTVSFRRSEAYQKWKELLHHYYDPFPVVEHYENIQL